MALTSESVNPAGASLKVNVITAVSPDFTPDTLLLMVKVGAKVSIPIVVLPAPPALPAVSVYAPALTLIDAVASVLAEGVKVAV